MEKLSEFIGHIDWIFCGILIIAGRYWGGKYFNLSKNPAHNFLAFATCFGALWIIIQKIAGKFSKDDLESIFITYLFATSFYELLGKKLLEKIEGNFPTKKEEEK